METSDSGRLKMAALIRELGPKEGARETVIGGVTLVRSNVPSKRCAAMYEPCIVLVAQGLKRGYLEDRVFTYDASTYLTFTVPAPFECDTVLDGANEYLGMSIRIDLSTLGDLLMEMDERQIEAMGVCPHDSLSETPMNDALRGAAIRLLESLRNPSEAKVLGPQIVREILYRVLCGQRAGALHALMMASGSQMQVHRILHRIHTNYAEPFHVGAIAAEFGMSVSALHQHFKTLTEKSPLQYLKSVRLHRARMMMAQDGLGAAEAAQRVGYESASQFSREFKRMFGFSPAEEAQRARRLLGWGVPEAELELAATGS